MANSRRRSEREKLFDKISNSIDMVPLSSGMMHIEIDSNRRISVDGCKGILEYDECVIKLNTGRLVVRICGSELTVTALENEQAFINGNITSVDFSGG